ncbi:MAG: hypothetical protein K6G51_03435, partial [Sphaerochaetaceae bacterium]|nr:hypothetical protein [Sphaerochaetaceae bacterium]
MEIKMFTDESIALSFRLDKAKKNVKEALGFFNNDLVGISQILAKYYPLEILKLTIWEQRRILIQKKNDESARNNARLLPLLVQSVFQSELYRLEKKSTERNVLPKDFRRLIDLCSDAARRLEKYIENTAVIAVKEGKLSESNYRVYRDYLFEGIFTREVSDSEYAISKGMLFNIVSDSDRVASELYHTDSATLCDSLVSLCDNGRHGIDDMSANSSTIEMVISNMVEERKKKGDTRDERAIASEVVEKQGFTEAIEAIKRRTEGYDLFLVRANCTLSEESCKELSFEAGSVKVEDFLKFGLLPASYMPFVTFEGEYYTFVAGSLFSNYLSVLNYKLKYQEIIPDIYVLQSLAHRCLSLLMRDTDSVDVWAWRNTNADVIFITTLRIFDGISRPERFESKCQRVLEERAIKAKPGHIILFIESDSWSELKELGEGIFSVSLPYLQRAGENDTVKYRFLERIFGQAKNPETEDKIDLEFADVYDENETLSEEREQIKESQEVEEETMAEDNLEASLDEYEYDKAISDEEAIEQNEEVENVDNEKAPEEIKTNYHAPTHSELKALQESWELPKRLEKEEEESNFELFDTDDYVTENVTDNVESEEVENVEDDLFDDDTEVEEEIPVDSFMDDSPEDPLEKEIENEEFDEIPQDIQSSIYAYHVPIISEEEKLEKENGQLSLFDGVEGVFKEKELKHNDDNVPGEDDFDESELNEEEVMSFNDKYDKANDVYDEDDCDISSTDELTLEQKEAEDEESAEVDEIFNEMLQEQNEQESSEIVSNEEQVDNNCSEYPSETIVEDEIPSEEELSIEDEIPSEEELPIE